MENVRGHFAAFLAFKAKLNFADAIINFLIPFKSIVVTKIDTTNFLLMKLWKFSPSNLTKAS